MNDTPLHVPTTALALAMGIPENYLQGAEVLLEDRVMRFPVKYHALRDRMIRWYGELFTRIHWRSAVALQEQPVFIEHDDPGVDAVLTEIRRRVIVAHSIRGASAEVIHLTPTVARALLTLNKDNRPPSTRELRKLIRELEEGRGELNGSTIVLSQEGWMADGQHRCLAVRETGVSYPTLLSTGTTWASRMSLDRNKARVPGDFLAMTKPGTQNVSLVASALQLTEMLNQNDGKWMGTPWVWGSGWTIEAAAEANPEVAGFAAEYVHISGKTKHLIRPALAIFLMWLLSQGGQDKDRPSSVFMERLLTGTIIEGEHDPVLKSRNALGNIKPSGASKHAKDAKVIGIVLRGWLAWRNGKTKQTLRPIDPLHKNLFQIIA